MESSLEDRSTSSTWRNALPASAVVWVRWGLVAVIIVSAVIIARGLPLDQLQQSIAEWARRPTPWQALIFVGIFVLLTILSLPVWQMPFLAGAIFGVLQGALLTSAGCCAGAVVTFFMSRSLGRTRFRNWLERSARLRALEKAVTSGSWKVVAAVRLSHLLPFGLQNYAFGLTGIRFRTFILTTWLITLPGLTLQSYLGNLGFQSLESWQARTAHDWQFWATRIGGLLALAAAVSYIGYLVRNVYVKKIRTQLEQAAAEEGGSRDGLSRWDIALAVAAGLFLIAAVWSAVERDALRGVFSSLLP